MPGTLQKLYKAKTRPVFVSLGSASSLLSFQPAFPATSRLAGKACDSDAELWSREAVNSIHLGNIILQSQVQGKAHFVFLGFF